jgi:hypothetical protein
MTTVPAIEIFWASELPKPVFSRMWNGAYFIWEQDDKEWVGAPFKGNEKSPEKEGMFCVEKTKCHARDLRTLFEECQKRDAFEFPFLNSIKAVIFRSLTEHQLLVILETVGIELHEEGYFNSFSGEPIEVPYKLDIRTIGQFIYELGRKAGERICAADVRIRALKEGYNAGYMQCKNKIIKNI